MSQFLNPSFELDTNNDLLPDGWTINLERFTAGQTFTIGGVTYTSPLDTTYPTDNASRNLLDDDTATLTYNAALQTNQKTNGTTGLELISTGQSVGYGIVRGPWVYSSEFDVLGGQELTFDWQAQNGGDAFDVFGFLLNTTTGATQIVLNETGGSAKLNGTGVWGSTTGGWQSSSVTVADAGLYRFVFLSGTFDQSGGRALGATLYLDNFGGAAVFGDIGYSANTFSEANVNSGEIANTVTLTLQSSTDFANVTFADTTHYTITGVPTGLSAVVTRIDAKTVTVSISGSATAHANTDDVLNISLSFTDAAFTGGAVASTIGGATNKRLYVDFYESSNTAPTGLGNLTLPAILEDSSPSGLAISAMTGLDFQDGGGSLGGIVVVGNTASDSQGVWQFSTNSGTNWSAIGAVSELGGLSLSASTLLRFLPARDYNGSVTGLTVRALDTSADLYSSTDPSVAARVVLNASYNGNQTAIAALTNTINHADITAVNDAPSFTKGANQTVGENSGAKTVANWASAISAGAANEGAQTLAFTVTNNNNNLFSVQPTTAADGTLTYTLANGASGTATVTVTLGDTGGLDNSGANASVSQTFTITVDPAPVISNLNLDSQSVSANTALKLDAGSSVSVADNAANFNGGSLVITKAAGSKSGFFTLDGAVGQSGGNAVLVDGENISVNGTIVGTLVSAGKDATDLQISLNGNATPARVATLLQNLSYQSGDAGSVRLEVVITDSVGARSSAAAVLLTFTGASESVEGATVEPGLINAFGNNASAPTERKVISTGGDNENLADGPSSTLIDVQFTNTPGETVYAQFSNGLSGYIGASSGLLSSTEMIDMSRWSQVFQGEEAGRAHQSFVMDTSTTRTVLNEIGAGDSIRFLYAGDFEINGGDGTAMVFSVENTPTEGVTDVINVSRPGTEQIVLDLDGFTGMAITGRGVDVIGSSENNYIITDGAGTIEMGNGRDVIVLNDMNAIVNGGQDLDVARVFGNSFSVNVTDNGGILYVTNGLGTTMITDVELLVLDNGYYKKDIGAMSWQWVDEMPKNLDALALIGVQGTEVFL